MKALSQHLAELSVQAKKAEDHAAKAQSEAKEHLDQRREQTQLEVKAALDKVRENVSGVNADAQARFERMRTKVNSDFENLKEGATERKQKFEAWQANNYADDKEADAAAAIDYAIASTKIAELATLDAIEARGRAVVKAELVEPIPA